PDLAEGVEHDRISGVGAPHELVDQLVAPPFPPDSGEPGECLLADLCLPASGRPAATRAAVRVDHRVASLAGVSSGPEHRLAVDDEAEPEADLTRDVDHVAEAAGRPAPRLGEDTDVGLVGDADVGDAERPG